jgi:hypothetical protein
MIVIPCFLSSRKNNTIISTHTRKKWKRKEGEERKGSSLAP